MNRARLRAEGLDLRGLHEAPRPNWAQRLERAGLGAVVLIAEAAIAALALIALVESLHPWP